ncbi:MAG: hypothetical protein AAB731_04420 [Patescibacteria group bacterium]
MKRAIIILAILLSYLPAAAEERNAPFFSGFETQTGWSDSWNSALRYNRITQSVELRYRLWGFLDGYTYLVGQTGWMRLKAPAAEIRKINLYLYPNLLVGQGFEVKKALRDFCELAAFAEIYSSLHTAVAEVRNVDLAMPKDSPGAMLAAYDTNIGEVGIRAGVSAYKNFARWSARFGARYELEDFDVFMNPKVLAFKDTPPKVSQINATWQFMRFAAGASVNLPKRLKLSVDANLDVARYGVSGYGAAIGLGYSF